VWLDRMLQSVAGLPQDKLTYQRLEEFLRVLDGDGMSLSSISMTRHSVVDREHGQENFDDALRFIELAPSFGVTVVNTGFMQALTPAQQEAVWFWLCDGHVDDPALRELAVERVQQLGDAAQRQGVQVSLEMYEDTYIGTADEAVAFITDVDHPAVGL